VSKTTPKFWTGVPIPTSLRDKYIGLPVVLSVKVVVDLDLGVGVNVGEFLVGEETFKGLHDVLDEGTVVHVLDEHSGFVGTSLPVLHFDLVDAGSEDQHGCQKDK
jgi:hypothetical protein